MVVTTNYRTRRDKKREEGRSSVSHPVKREMEEADWRKEESASQWRFEASAWRMVARQGGSGNGLHLRYGRIWSRGAEGGGKGVNAEEERHTQANGII